MSDSLKANTFGLEGEIGELLEQSEHDIEELLEQDSHDIEELLEQEVANQCNLPEGDWWP